jgi:hypothetical protein
MAMTSRSLHDDLRLELPHQPPLFVFQLCFRLRSGRHSDSPKSMPKRRSECTRARTGVRTTCFRRFSYARSNSFAFRSSCRTWLHNIVASLQRYAVALLHSVDIHIAARRTDGRSSWHTMAHACTRGALDVERCMLHTHCTHAGQ